MHNHFHPSSFHLLSTPRTRQAAKLLQYLLIEASGTGGWNWNPGMHGWTKLPEVILNHDVLNGWYSGQQQPNHQTMQDMAGHPSSQRLDINDRLDLLCNMRAVLFCFVSAWKLVHAGNINVYKRGLTNYFFSISLCTSENQWKLGTTTRHNNTMPANGQ